EYSPWTHSLFKGVSGGFYWTDHLKTEIEVAWPGEREATAYVRTFTADAYTSDRHYFRGVNTSIGQLYQFGRNSFFHPFVGAGVDIDRTRHTIERRVETRTSVTETE